MKQLAGSILLVGVMGSALALSASSANADGNSDDFCPRLYQKGVLSLDFNPAFLSIDEFDDADQCEKSDGLVISSFFNLAPPVRPDLVAMIPDIGNVDDDTFDASTDVKYLTPATGSSPIIWPNEAERVPDSVGLGFEGVIIPQGFHPAAAPGRLTIVDVETGEEYVVDQSTQAPFNPMGPPVPPHTPGNSPRFYHRGLFIDMDNDGFEDIVTVRSGFRVGPVVYPPFSELVWFRNPLGPDENGAPGELTTGEWDEFVLYGGPLVAFMGPDIHLDAADLTGDGVVEIVATHFFTGDVDLPPPGPPVPGQPPAPPQQPTKGKIALYGLPPGATSWAQVNQFNPAVGSDISTDQGFPFDVEFVDLNRDGKLDILATNHQPDQVNFFSDVPGRIYALEQPMDSRGRVLDPFENPWTTHILKDDILANPTPGDARQPPGRLAPGKAKVFWPERKVKKGKKDKKPWLVVGGDEASKVWVLKPKSENKKSWDYKSAVIFDINEFYGPCTTQTEFFGVSISTIGAVAVRYTEPKRGKKGKKKSYAEIYIPVFEGRDIHVLSFEPGTGNEVLCSADVPVGEDECPAGEPPVGPPSP